MLRLSVAAPLVQILILYRLTRMWTDYKISNEKLVWTGKSIRNRGVNKHLCYFNKTYVTLKLNKWWRREVSENLTHSLCYCKALKSKVRLPLPYITVRFSAPQGLVDSWEIMGTGGYLFRKKPFSYTCPDENNNSEKLLFFIF